MHFLEHNELWEWCEDHGLATEPGPGGLGRIAQQAPRTLERLAFDYRRPEDAPGLARKLVEALGAWDEAILWVTSWGIWPSSEDWPAYYAARGAYGEKRSIDKAPGHRFGASERETLIEFTAMSLRNGWDALVIASNGGSLNPVRLQLDHDEWAEVQTSS